MDAKTKHDLYDFLLTVDSFINEIPVDKQPIEFFDDKPKQKILTLDEISSNIKTCTKCKRSGTRTQSICGEGVKNPLVLVIGDAPNADEDAANRPFVGEIGQLLDKMLLSISLSRQKNCFITNCVHCYQPNIQSVPRDDFESCVCFLHNQIAVLRPKFILCFGEVAMRYFLDVQDSISTVHGQFFDYKQISFMATYHPRDLLQNDEYKRPVWEDLKRFRQKILQVVPSYIEEFEKKSFERK
ncbi:MAG: uracil-DNA glycosylase [Treponemataceae bacterium]